ncbi:MAG: hypothetical protein SPI78_01450, partial [Bergeyella zoohelcum]|nr:hypothetical protein [Bergeyella zoohelcum]
AVGQGVLSVMQGGSFEQAFWSGALGSLGASAFGAIAGDFASSAGGTIAFGALSGGIGAELSGGNFWEGAVIGGIVAGLNHVAHQEKQNIGPPDEDNWFTEFTNFISGGAVDDARAMLAFEATNPSTMDRAMFHVGLNARDVKREFIGYGMGARGGLRFGKNIAPKGWKQQVSKKGGGIVFKDPRNPHNIIRQMPGNPKSPNIAQRMPYVKFMKNGKFYDVNGNVLKNGALPEAHIPLNKFNINKMPK